MQLRTKLAAALGAVGVAAAAFAPMASADRGVGFSVSVGGPGYSFNVGNYGSGYYDYWRPAPVVVAPYTPYYGASYYSPRPVVVAPPVVYRPYPVYRTYYRDNGRHNNHWRDNNWRDNNWRDHRRWGR